MSGLPPQLDTTDAGTPAQEWARSITTAAFARAQPAPAMSESNKEHIEPTTGGVSISSSNDAQKGPFDPTFTEGGVPGAYPPTPGDQDPTRQTSVTETAQAAGRQASAFVQTAATTAAQYLPKGVVDTVSSYIPTSSATATMSTARASEHDSEHKTSFPTAELSGAGNRENVGGVGSLPGPVNETAVPKLPHERVDDERYMTAAGAAAAVAGGAYALKDRIVGAVPSQEEVKQTAQSTAQSTAQTVKQTIPGVKSHTTAVTASTLPAHEPFGAQPGDRSLGVGVLPGHQSESNVALLPEESAHPQYDSGSVGTDAQIALKPTEETKGNEAATGSMRNIAGVGALVGDRSEEGVARLPSERSTGTTANVGVAGVFSSRDEQGRQHTRALSPGDSAIQSRDDKPPAPPAKDDDSTKKSMGTSGHKGAPNQGPGYDTDYHPAELHPRAEGASDPAQHASAGEKSMGATQADANRPDEEQPPPHSGDGQKERKATFMEKMKGEAKVLIGKVEGKHEKVVAGQKMKSGEAKMTEA